MDEKNIAPYGSWATFVNTLERFTEVGVPPRIDRTAFPGLEWNAASRLLGALRFFGMIDELGNPQGPLYDVVVAEGAERPKALEALMRKSYAALFDLDLSLVTPGHLADTISQQYNVKGDTLEKAMRFFLAAASFVGLELSPLLLREKTRRPTKRTAKTAKAAKPATSAPAATPAASPAQTPSNSGSVRTITLDSGGTVTVNAVVDWLALTPRDREFVFGLIDALATYERNKGGIDV
jgi:Family of unknown function (DUF5343)